VAGYPFSSPRALTDKPLYGRSSSQRRQGLFRRLAFVLAAMLPGLAPGIAQDTEPIRGVRDLTEATLEDLMSVEVTTVSKKQQKLSRTAAAVYVIKQEDIRRSGATNSPDVLRMAPGS